MATKVRFILRQAAADQWVAANPTLMDGEPGIEKDTRRVKFGDGATAWIDLPYAADEAASVVAEAGARADADAALQGQIDAIEGVLPDALMDGDEAGGVLSGTFPNPEFATDMATQEELDAESTARADGDAALQSDIDDHVADVANPHAVTKAQVGLPLVDNTSDEDKPISALTQTALDTKLDNSQKGAANGLAELDGTGRVPTAQLPSYVDDVVPVADFAALPVTGESGKIYVTEDTNLTYRWSGSAYVEISASLALGENSATAYRGDRGKVAFDHSQDISTNPHNVTKAQVGLGLADNTSDIDKPISAAQQVAFDEEAALARDADNLTSGTVPDARLEPRIGRAVSTDGSFSLPEPTGTGLELVVTADVLTGVRLDDVSVRDFGPSRLPVVAGARPGVSVNGPGGGQLGKSWRNWYTVMCDADSLEVSFTNTVRGWGGDGLGTHEIPGPNAFLLFAAVEVSGTGAKRSFSLFPGGVDVQPGEVVRSVCPIEVKQGDRVFVRTQVAVTDLGRTDSATGSAASSTITDASCVAGDVGKWVSGTNILPGSYVGVVTPGVSFTMVDYYGTAIKPSGAVTSVTIGQHQWPLSFNGRNTPAADGDLNTSAAPTVDITVNNSFSAWAFSGLPFFGPSMVTGLVRGAPVPSVLVVGDSISWGVGSTSQASSWQSRALEAASIPHQILAIGGSTEIAFSQTYKRQLEMALIGATRFTDAIDAYGTNDLGLAFSSMANNALATARALSARGIRVWNATVLPNTAPGNETNRVGFNTWLRAGAPIDPTTKAYVAVGTPGALVRGDTGHPMHGLIEAANAVETAQNSGVWASGMTTDGVHPTEAGHAALAAALDVSRFTL